MIISAAQILDAIADEEPDQEPVADSLALFVKQYKPLGAAGLTRRQVADQLGLSESAVKERLFRARRRGLLDRRPDRECGTLAAYRAHRRRGEDADRACLRTRNTSSRPVSA
jgi:DNA-binding NarL/FixJ family response regulator